MKHAKQAFTLVELIVVITILAILGTIGFISLQGYGNTARDSVRITDISTIQKSAELFMSKTGTYPVPDNGTGVTYEDSVVWTQGTVGASVIAQLKQLSNIPLDPLLLTEYAYSVTQSKKEFQIGSILEGTPIAQTSLMLSTAQAESSQYIAFVKGPYNGQFAKTSTGAITYVFALPSILGSDLTETDLIDIITKKGLVYDGYNNVPSTATNTSSTGGFDFGGVSLDIVVYSGAIDTLVSDMAELTAMAEKLQTVYSGSILASDLKYSSILAMDVTQDDSVVAVAGKMVSQSTGKKISAEPAAVIPPAEPCLTQGEVDNLISQLDPVSVVLNSTTLLKSNDAIPTTVEDWCNITGLTTSSIIGIPSEIGNMVQLVNLNLETYNTVTTMPDSIGDLVNLESLVISGSFITSIPTTLGGLTSLISLTIVDNPYITSLPDSIGSLTNLTTLDLRSSISSRGNINTLPLTLVNLNNLTSLDLTLTKVDNNLKTEFTPSSTILTSNLNFPTTGKTMSIAGNGTTIDITVTP